MPGLKRDIFMWYVLLVVYYLFAKLFYLFYFLAIIVVSWIESALTWEITNHCNFKQIGPASSLPPSQEDIDKVELGGREVGQEFPFISSVRVWERVVEHTQSPFLAVTHQHRTRSNINTFTAIFYQVSLPSPPSICSWTFLHLVDLMETNSISVILTGAEVK